MGIRDRVRQFKAEWDATPEPKTREAKPKNYGTCNQRNCTDPAIGPAGLCNTHAASI